MQPIIISQGTIEERIAAADQIIKKILADQIDYVGHMDFKLYELAEDKKLIAIEQVRELIREINIKPRISDKKVIWIKEAQSLSPEAQNALLKTLEEPPSYSQIILTVDHPNNLISTVLSRCIIKNLNLSARINLDSKEYEEYKSEFLELLSLETGAKIDWVTENKNRLKDRNDVITLLNYWEAVLRDKMLDAVKNNGEPEVWKEKLQFLQTVKSYIQLNANVSLAIETLLLNI